MEHNNLLSLVSGLDTTWLGRLRAHHLRSHLRSHPIPLAGPAVVDVSRPYARSSYLEYNGPATAKGEGQGAKGKVQGAKGKVQGAKGEGQGAKR